tara:strand:+ start:135 stop:2201 length:2067 start_codon:yes stop_codon:yes gene_type:complete
MQLDMCECSCFVEDSPEAPEWSEMKIRAMATEVVDRSILWAAKAVVVRGGSRAVQGYAYVNEPNTERYVSMPAATVDLSHMISGFYKPDGGASSPDRYAHANLGILDAAPLWWDASTQGSYTVLANATARTNKDFWADKCASFCARAAETTHELAYIMVDTRYGEEETGCQCYAHGSNHSILSATDGDAMAFMYDAEHSETSECTYYDGFEGVQSYKLCDVDNAGTATLQSFYCFATGGALENDARFLPRASNTDECVEQDCINQCMRIFGVDACRGYVWADRTGATFGLAETQTLQCMITSQGPCDANDNFLVLPQVAFGGSVPSWSASCAPTRVADGAATGPFLYAARVKPYSTSLFVENLQGTLLYQSSFEVGMEVSAVNMQAIGSQYSEQPNAYDLEDCMRRCIGALGTAFKSVRWHVNGHPSSSQRCICVDVRVTSLPFDPHVLHSGTTEYLFYDVQWCDGVRYPSERILTWVKSSNDWCPGVPAGGGYILETSSTSEYTIAEDAGAPVDETCRARCEGREDCAFAEAYVQTWEALQTIRAQPPPPLPPSPPRPPPSPEPPLPPLPPVSPPSDINAIRAWHPRGTERPLVDEDGRNAVTCGLKETRAFNATVFAASSQIEAIDLARQIEDANTMEVSLCPWECAQLHFELSLHTPHLTPSGILGYENTLIRRRKGILPRERPN